VDFSRKAPGLLLRDILRGKADDVAASIAVIAKVDPDILLIAGIDYDLQNSTIRAFNAAMEEHGLDYPYVFAARPNTGMATGLDMDGDGRRGTARDAQGYGRYAGAEGMALFSRYPIKTHGARDFSDLLWQDFPEADLPHVDGRVFPTKEALAVQRLSTTAHWDVPIETPDGLLHIFAYFATPPVFDGDEDRNGRRNQDETRFWSAYLDGKLAPDLAPTSAFVILGGANLDPMDGDGRGAAMRTLLAHSRIFDAGPASVGGAEAANLSHSGNPALDTADWADEGVGPGNLRVDYVLPSRELRVLDSGVFWPSEGSADAALIAAGEGITRHRLVWIDVALP
jgi:hypothetical protein